MVKYIFVFLILSTHCFSSFSQEETNTKNNKFDTIKNIIARIDLLNETAIEAINNDPEEAREYAKEAMLLAKKENYNQGKAYAYYNLGNVNYYLDEYEEGLLNLDSAKTLFEYEKNEKGLGFVFNTMGEIYTLMGNYGEALKPLFTALQHFELARDNTGKSRVNNNIGLIHYYQKNYQEALKYFKQALKTADEIRTGDASLYIGKVYVDLNNFSEARKYISKAMEIGKKNEDQYILSDGYYLLGRVDAFYGETDLAMIELMKSQSIKEELGDNQGIALACVQIGNLYLSKKEPLKAKKYFLLSRDIANQIGAKYEIKDACMGLSNTYSYLNLYDSAYFYLNEYNKVYQELISEEASKKLVELEASLAAQRREEQIASERKIEALNRNIMIISGIALILIMGGVAFMMYNRYKLKKKANDQLAKYNTEILLQKDIIEAKNRDIMDSIKYAKRIQEAILPSNEILAKSLPDFFVFYKPKDIVSGDFYWAHTLSDKKILFAAVDCTGHGVPGAFVSIVGFNGLNRAVKEFGFTQPAKILDELNILVDETFLSHGSTTSIKDGMDINLCALEYLPDGNARLEFAAANNPLWIFRKTEPVLFEEVKADMQPIGAFFNRKPFTNHEILLNKGDCFYIFSDGYADQFGGDKGKKYKYKKFRELLAAMNDKPMEEQKEIINSEIVNWMEGEYEQIDDMCIIGVRV